MATVKTDRDGSHEINLPDDLYGDGTSADLILTPDRPAELFVECGNCCGTANTRISVTDLRELRDFLNEHVKD